MSADGKPVTDFFTKAGTGNFVSNRTMADFIKCMEQQGWTTITADQIPASIKAEFAGGILAVAAQVVLKASTMTITPLIFVEDSPWLNYIHPTIQDLAANSPYYVPLWLLLYLWWVSNHNKSFVITPDYAIAFQSTLKRVMDVLRQDENRITFSLRKRILVWVNWRNQWIAVQGLRAVWGIAVIRDTPHGPNQAKVHRVVSLARRPGAVIYSLAQLERDRDHMSGAERAWYEGGYHALETDPFFPGLTVEVLRYEWHIFSLPGGSCRARLLLHHVERFDCVYRNQGDAFSGKLSR